MARGGLSSDPETRERQLAALADGRRIARERREAGLPTKRNEARQSPADPGSHGQSPAKRSRGSGKVVRGTYAKGGAARGGRAASDPKNNDQGGDADEGPSLSRLERAYARLLGVDLDA